MPCARIASVYAKRKRTLWCLICTLHQWRQGQNGASAHKDWQDCDIRMYPGDKRYQIVRTGWSIWFRIHGHGLRNTLPSPVVVPLRRRELDTITIEFVRIRGRCYQEIRTDKKLACRPKIDINCVMI